MKIWLLRRVLSKIFFSSLIFLEFKKLKIYIMTKVLKIKVKCLEGVNMFAMLSSYSVVPLILYFLPDLTKSLASVAVYTLYLQSHN